MPGRLTWFAIGAASGVYAMVKAKRTARSLTPAGLAGRAAALQAGFRVFASEVSRGMAERESDLRAQLAAPLAVPPSTELITRGPDGDR